MAEPVTLAMDADGRVVLTTEQAAMLARYFLSDDGADGNELAVALDHAHNSAELAFARWVRCWAPVVAAAERQDAEQRAADFHADCECPYCVECEATEAAVRAARQGEAVPA